jgi:hypothetical protein
VAFVTAGQSRVLANERASEPTRAERGSRAPASERVGESEGRSPSVNHRDASPRMSVSSMSIATVLWPPTGMMMSA